MARFNTHSKVQRFSATVKTILNSLLLTRSGVRVTHLNIVTSSSKTLSYSVQSLGKALADNDMMGPRPPTCKRSLVVLRSKTDTKWPQSMQHVVCGHCLCLWRCPARLCAVLWTSLFTFVCSSLMPYYGHFFLGYFASEHQGPLDPLGPWACAQ